MDRVINFRDFGGLETRFGGRVKTDRLYRSGHMAAVSAAEITRMLGLDFALIADLRDPHERAKDPSSWPKHYAERLFAHNVPQATLAPHLEILHAVVEGEAAVDRGYRQHYADIAHNPAYRELFVSVLNRLVDLNGRALIHCTAGKDRTGVLSALILHALGVPRPSIVQEYLRSRNAPGFDALHEQVKTWVVSVVGPENADQRVSWMLGAKEEYLASALGAIEEEAGSLDAYLDGVGLTEPRRELLRAKFVDG